MYTEGEVTSQSLWSRYDRHFVGITRHDAELNGEDLSRVIRVKLNPFKKISRMSTDLRTKRT